MKKGKLKKEHNYCSKQEKQNSSLVLSGPSVWLLPAFSQTVLSNFFMQIISFIF